MTHTDPAALAPDALARLTHTAEQLRTLANQIAVCDCHDARCVVGAARAISADALHEFAALLTEREALLADRDLWRTQMQYVFDALDNYDESEAIRMARVALTARATPAKEPADDGR